jgi:hypothetical protein
MEFGRDNSEQQSLCPGESNCERYQSARGKDHRQKEKNACFNCELFSSKINPAAEKVEAYLDNLVSRIRDLRIEQSMGYLPDKSRITPIEFEGLKYVCFLFEKEDRTMKLLNNKYLELLLKKPIL